LASNSITVKAIANIRFITFLPNIFPLICTAKRLLQPLHALPQALHGFQFNQRWHSECHGATPCLLCYYYITAVKYDHNIVFEFFAEKALTTFFICAIILKLNFGGQWRIKKHVAG